MRHRILSALVAMGVVVSAPAYADPSATDKSLAQSLFDQGKGLMDRGNFDQACPKLEESQRLDPGGGTLLNLALCHEQQGKVATAWTEFKSALSDAKRDARQDRITAAEEHIAVLEPKLPRLTLMVTAPIGGEELKLDGAAVGKGGWGTPVAVDPGPHGLSATGPGKKTWVQALSLGLAEKKTVTVPVLETDPNQAAPPPAPVAGPAPAPGPAPPPAPSERHHGGSSTTLGWVVGGAGVVALGVGTFFGFQALSKKKASDDHCPTDTTCTKEGVSLNDQANTAAWASDFGIGFGLVGVGIGTYLVLTSGGGSHQGNASRPGTGIALDAGVLPGGGKMAVSGAW